MQQFIHDGFSSVMLWVLEANPTRRFYDQMGGKSFAAKIGTFGGKDFKELAYGWDRLESVVAGGKK